VAERIVSATNGIVAVVLTATALLMLWTLQLKVIVMRWTGLANCCHHHHHPLISAGRFRGIDESRRILIVFITAMVAGSVNGLPWQQVRQ
jgi:hypothetical protein